MKEKMNGPLGSEEAKRQAPTPKFKLNVENKFNEN